MDNLNENIYIVIVSLFNSSVHIIIRPNPLFLTHYSWHTHCREYSSIYFEALEFLQKCLQ